MTLVVGKIKDNHIRFISDSKITDKDSVRNNPLAGNLKTFILNPCICLSFSGNTYFAEKLLIEHYEGKFSDFSRLLHRCLVLNNESNNETFFCIGTLYNNQPMLYKIYDRKIDNNIENVWIGDKIAFEKYQESYHSSTEKDGFNRMEKAFDNVIKDEKIITVSDFQISVETVFASQFNNLIFMYTHKMSMSFAPQKFTLTIKPGQNSQGHLIPFGGADIGGFGTSYLRSINLILPAIAIHFPQGEFGVLFCPEINQNKPIIHTGKPDGEDFAYEILEKYNIPLQGFVAKDGVSMKYIVIDKPR